MGARQVKRPFVCIDRGRFYVRGLPDSVESPGRFETRRAAEVWLEGKADVLAAIRVAEAASGKGAARPCMCCAATFESAGPHNRLCDPCRKRGSAEGQAVSYSFGAMTGRRRSA